MRPEFWRGKRVFVTGHTGFKGSWLALWLQRMGAEVLGYSLPAPTTPSLFALARIGERVATVTADIRDAERLQSELCQFCPDVVLHLAAQSVVLQSYEDPLETYSTNVVGTASVLQAVRQLSRSCVVVNVTTDKVYENRGWVWGYRESDRLGGRDPYSNSKACAELVAQSFYDSFFAPHHGAAGVQVGLASARAGNVIGGGDWTPRQLIPDSVAAFSGGKSVILRNPAATRPWQHVLDCLSGYLTLAEALSADAARFAGGWNFGPADGDMQPVARVVEMLAEHWRVATPWVQDPLRHPHEEMELRLNSQRAERELRWRTRLTLDKSLALTAEWYHGLHRGTDPRSLCEEQIDHYVSLG